MKLLKQIFFLLILSSFILKTYAQQPAHRIVGEFELSGVNIYNIIQDKNSCYWLATNNGIIKYDGYSFENIETERNLSNSFFDFQMDYNNDIYCKNFSGQIFKIENDTCREYFRLPNNLLSNEIWYSFDNYNDLIVLSNSFIKVSKEGEIKHILEGYFNDIFLIKMQDSSIQFIENRRNKFSSFKNNKITTEPVNVKNIYLCSFLLGDSLFYCDLLTGNILERNNMLFTKKKQIISAKHNVFRLYSDNKNLWIIKTGGGVYCFDENLKPLFNNKLLFKNNIISSVMKDKAGNTIMGTFGDGLIFIPNINLINIDFPDNRIKTTKICSANDSIIFAGTQSGQIFKINKKGTTQLFHNEQLKYIEVLEFFEVSNELLFDNGGILFINISTNEQYYSKFGALKDIEYIDTNKYLIAFNRGVAWFDPTVSTKSKSFKKKLIYFLNFRNRTYCANIDLNTNTIYAGTSVGLKIGNEIETNFFSFNNKAVIAKDILYFKEKIYITTEDFGILIFENNKLINQWTTSEGLISDSPNKICEYNNNLYISSKLGLQIVKLSGESIGVLNQSEGLQTNNILDFEISNNNLWILNQKALQKIELSKIIMEEYLPTISLSEILLNDSILICSNNSRFTYNQNKLKFNVSAISLKYENEIEYHYMLEGIDNTTQINNYYENSIEYKTLPHGKYTFKIKAVCRNKESETLIYKFSISPPIWQTWWFFVLFTIVGAGLTILVFKIRINKIKYTNELEKQLKISEITAIKAQMNPHFIFNAINSIQDLILKGDIENSYNYIIKFSQMVRQTLNYSDKEFIDIEDEIQLLEIYLKLEKLRFKDDFSYSISLNNADDIIIPPMLVQPFVENAIKHGLLHKEGFKELKIEFKKDKILYCTISDNGIGLKKSEEIKKRRQSKHKSFSTKATKSRFEIMKTHYKQDIGVDYYDLSPNNTNTGTKVVIRLPFKQKY